MVQKIKSKTKKEHSHYSFAEMAVINKGKNSFLELVLKIVNWKKIEEILSGQVKSSNIGASSYSNLFLFKIVLLQSWYGLSDPVMEEQLNDRISFIRFLGISLDSPTPDHSTISRYRTFLMSNKIYEVLFSEINTQLQNSNLMVKNGVIVDASVIQ